MVAFDAVNRVGSNLELAETLFRNLNSKVLMNRRGYSIVIFSNAPVSSCSVLSQLSAVMTTLFTKSGKLVSSRFRLAVHGFTSREVVDLLQAAPLTATQSYDFGCINSLQHHLRQLANAAILFQSFRTTIEFADSDKMPFEIRIYNLKLKALVLPKQRAQPYFIIKERNDLVGLEERSTKKASEWHAQKSLEIHRDSPQSSRESSLKG